MKQEFNYYEVTVNPSNDQSYTIYVKQSVYQTPPFNSKEITKEDYGYFNS